MEGGSGELVGNLYTPLQVAITSCAGLMSSQALLEGTNLILFTINKTTLVKAPQFLQNTG